MKVLFDVNMPRQLCDELPGCEIVTAQAMSWSELVNGDLIEAAERKGFDVMVTADRSLSYQQNLSNRKIAISILPSNKLRILKRMAPVLLAALKKIKSGEFIELPIQFP